MSMEDPEITKKNDQLSLPAFIKNAEILSDPEEIKTVRSTISQVMDSGAVADPRFWGLMYDESIFGEEDDTSLVFWKGLMHRYQNNQSPVFDDKIPMERVFQSIYTLAAMDPVYREILTTTKDYENSNDEERELMVQIQYLTNDINPPNKASEKAQQIYRCEMALGGYYDRLKSEKSDELVPHNKMLEDMPTQTIPHIGGNPVLSDTEATQALNVEVPILPNLTEEESIKPNINIPYADVLNSLKRYLDVGITYLTEKMLEYRFKLSSDKAKAILDRLESEGYVGSKEESQDPFKQPIIIRRLLDREVDPSQLNDARYVLALRTLKDISLLPPGLQHSKISSLDLGHWLNIDNESAQQILERMESEGLVGPETKNRNQPSLSSRQILNYDVDPSAYEIRSFHRN